MDIQTIDNRQLAWLRQHFKEGRSFFVIKDSLIPNQHYCKIRPEVSYMFTCVFHCKRRNKCRFEKRQANFLNCHCRLYEGPHKDK